MRNTGMPYKPVHDSECASAQSTGLVRQLRDLLCDYRPGKGPAARQCFMLSARPPLNSIRRIVKLNTHTTLDIWHRSLSHNIWYPI
jgi:hypothetical protein